MGEMELLLPMPLSPLTLFSLVWGAGTSLLGGALSPKASVQRSILPSLLESRRTHACPVLVHFPVHSRWVGRCLGSAQTQRTSSAGRELGGRSLQGLR